MLERLQKILSARGIASRRRAEEYITQGLVKVNGTIATLGQKADPEVDTIEVDGKVLEARQEMLYYVMHKPRGVETSNVGGDRSDRSSRGNRRVGTSDTSATSVTSETSPTVRDLLPPDLRGKVFPVGRLDKESEGLLLFTNDGVLAFRLTHPKFDHEKEYLVTVERPITEGALDKMRHGMVLSGEKTKPAIVTKTGPDRFRITLTEGKNRQIRRMCQKVGNPVKTLIRTRIMTLQAPALRAGTVRPLEQEERKTLLHAVGIDQLVA